MDSPIIAVILGLVEGLTEFLPVSSTGHLIITGNLLGFSGPQAATFEIVIQLGAILAVAVMYRSLFLGLVAPSAGHRFTGVRGILLLTLTTVPAVAVGLLGHDFIKEHLFGPRTVAWALGVGALAILVVEALPRRERVHRIDDITAGLALGIGLFQCLALWPGFSRSAATIMGGMLLGAERKTAAEYSFIAAVPIMCGATVFDLYKNFALFSADGLVFLGMGFAVSFLAAWIAVRWFIGLLGRTTLRPFAYYRLLLAPCVLLFWS